MYALHVANDPMVENEEWPKTCYTQIFEAAVKIYDYLMENKTDLTAA